VEPVDALREGTTLQPDGAPRDRTGGQGHPRQALICAGLQGIVKSDIKRKAGTLTLKYTLLLLTVNCLDDFL